MSLTEIAIKRPSLIVVIFAIIGLAGLVSYTQLKYELLPDMAPPVLSIVTVYPGASPNEVETTVSKEIEDALSSLEKIRNFRSTSSEGVSFVMIEFAQDADIDLAVQEAQRKVNGAIANFPPEVEQPVVNKFALDEVPILRAGSRANMAPREFYQLMKDQIKPQLTKIEGVGQISLVGGLEREIRVLVNADKLEKYGLSIGQVAEQINAYNLDFPTGKVENQESQYIVRVAGKFESLEQLRALVIGRSPVTGGEVRLLDVADVYDSTAERDKINRLNGEASIGVMVQKQSDANGVDVSALVQAELQKLEEEYAYVGLDFDVAFDNSDYTIEAADAVKKDLGIAVILVAVVMLIFLHSLRNSFIVMVAIPASLLGTFISMWVLDFSLNLMTLLGLSLVIGVLVDDSIVVLENIYRHLEMGKPKRLAALDGRNEIGFTALSITMVDVVVFLPLAFVGGIVGEIMAEFAIVVVVSTLMSLFVSFTITPALASRISKLSHVQGKGPWGWFVLRFERAFENLKVGYTDLLAWSIKTWWSRLTIFLIAVGLFISSLVVAAMFVGGAFIEQTDRGEFAVVLEMNPRSSLAETNRMSRMLEERIAAIPEVKDQFVTVGASVDGLLEQSASNSAEISVRLVPFNERIRSTDEVIAEIKNMTADIPGIKLRANPIGIFGTADETPLQLVVQGITYEEVLAQSDKVAKALSEIKGTTDVRLSSEDGKPEVRINVDREKMAEFGLSIAQVGGTLRTALTGDDDSKYRDGNTDYDIRVQLDGFDRQSVADVAGLTFVNPQGKLVELQQFASIEQEVGPTKLERYNRNAAIVVYGQLTGQVAEGQIATELDEKLAAMDWPVGMRYDWEGNIKNSRDSNLSLGFAFLAGIVLMYLIMVALYDNYAYPFVVLFSIPLAIIGALYALAMTGKLMTIFSILGIIMLIGLVGKNAILLVDFANQKKREEGMSTYDALLASGRDRLRPIFMTTLTMIFGMMPIALATGAGSEWKNGLAWALIGGLTSSMFLTLVLVPVVFMFIDKVFGWDKPKEADGDAPANPNSNGDTKDYIDLEEDLELQLQKG